jgi:hypothetical protein
MPQPQPVLCNPGLLGRVLDWVRARASINNEIATLSREELRRMASDLSLAESDLLALSTGGHDNTVLMERMMRARGLDADQMRNALGTWLRDVERVCTQCQNTGRCRRELDAETAAAHCHQYCPNAATFDELAAMPG